MYFVKKNRNRPNNVWIATTSPSCIGHRFPIKFDHHHFFEWTFSCKFITLQKQYKTCVLGIVAFMAENIDTQICAGSPHYMWSFYLQFCVYAIQQWSFSGTNPLIYSNPWSFYRYANLFNASLFLSHYLSPYNEVYLYMLEMLISTVH